MVPLVIVAAVAAYVTDHPNGVMTPGALRPSISATRPATAQEIEP